MKRLLQSAAVISLSATLILSGCSESVAPTDLRPSVDDSFFSHEPAPGFGAMVRNVPLVADLAATAVIGEEGGTLEIPGAKVVFEVPAGALSEDVEITMTALAGDVVAFRFAPHGLEFGAPARIRVGVQGTEAAWLLEHDAGAELQGNTLDRFLGVYFEGDPAVGVEPQENIATYLIDDAIAFDIQHFSGYVCASG